MLTTVMRDDVSRSGRPRPEPRRGRAPEKTAVAAGDAPGYPAARAPAQAGGKARARLPWPIAVFLIGLVVPWIIPIGPMNLSVYRIVLLATLLPCLFMWVSGRVGPIRLADVAVLSFSLWASLSLVVVHGLTTMIEAIGILNIETLGAYFLARCYIRTPDDFRNMVRLACWLVMILLPFALYEWVTGQKPLLTLFETVFPTVEMTRMEPRMGFWRVQGPFGHSIVFGLFCGGLLALAYQVLGYGRKGLSRWVRPAAVSFTAFLSMSSAPIAGMVMQLAFIGWNLALHRISYRWKIFWGIVFLGYLVVEFGSNQTPVQFYISRFTFDPQTGWYRLLIWDFGSATVASNPLFGIGMGDWARLPWMGDSVDNFWLLIAMRHGIPGVFLIFAACLAAICGVAYRKGVDEQVEAYRSGYVICLVMFMLVGCTVHFWAATYAWFLFLLGSGIWMLDAKPAEAALPEHPGTRMRRPERKPARPPAAIERKARGERREAEGRR